MINIWSQNKQIWAIFTHLKLWVAIYRYSTGHFCQYMAEPGTTEICSPSCSIRSLVSPRKNLKLNSLGGGVFLGHALFYPEKYSNIRDGRKFKCFNVAILVLRRGGKTRHCKPLYYGFFS